MEYIGIIENNDWEGEEFGYYFEDTPDTRENLEALLEKLPEDSPYEAILDPIDEDALAHMNKHDQNTYKKKVNIFNADEQPWDEILSADFEEDDPLYKGSCFTERLNIFDDNDEEEPYVDEDEGEEEW